MEQKLSQFYDITDMTPERTPIYNTYANVRNMLWKATFTPTSEVKIDAIIFVMDGSLPPHSTLIKQQQLNPSEEKIVESQRSIFQRFNTSLSISM